MNKPTKSGEHERAMPKPDEQHGSERPVPAKPQDHADPLWITVRNLGQNVGEHGTRLEKVETLATEAKTLATTAATKIDEKVARDVMFTSSFNRLTVAIVFMMLINVAMLIVFLARH